MFTKVRNIITVLAVVSMLAGCSGSGETNTGFEKDAGLSNPYGIKVVKIDSWVNLMPGSPESLFIKGELELEKSGTENPQFAKLVLVNIYQGTNLVYTFDPVVQEKVSKSKLKNKVLFSTVNGLLLNKKYDSNKNTIDVGLVFFVAGEKFSYLVKNVKVEKAY